MQVVQRGDISAEAPLNLVSEARLKANEVQEHKTVSVRQAVTCSVAFHRGQERSVLFSVHGMPQVCPYCLPLPLSLPLCCLSIPSALYDLMFWYNRDLNALIGTGQASST